MNSASTAALEIITFTTLFPNSAQPHHGIFVENRVRHLVAAGGINARVIAPVPYFPFSAPMFGRYAVYAKAAPKETRAGLSVEHPRYALLPKVGMNSVPGFLAAASFPVLKRFQRER